MPALKKGLSGLEPYEGKLSRTVLRGGSGGNITLLPGELSLVRACRTKRASQPKPS
jgi:hypothetical protein